MTALGRLPRLVAITDRTQLAPELLLRRSAELARAAAPGHLAVLLRDHELGARARLELGRELRNLTRAVAQQLWVADRIDLALALGADGLHLGEGSVSAREARSLLPAGLPVTRAWHQLALPEEAELQGVDALLLSPVLAARKGRPALGLDGLRAFSALAAARGVSVLALGGVTAATAAACLDAGAAGVAAIGAAWAPDVKPLLEALGASR